MSRMFKSIDDTWNVFVGCRFDCTYCNARKAALTRLRHVPRYQDGFEPHLVEAELKRTFKPSQFIFIAYMGDIAWATREQFLRILNRVWMFPDTNFLLQTKNPSFFTQFDGFPSNIYLGTTIETNRRHYTQFRSKSPTPVIRFRDLAGYPHNRKFLSIEPIMDFDPDVLIHWVELLQPDIVEVGVDNYHNSLPEPPWWKVEQLLKSLRQICPKVMEKDGLERLKGGN